MKRISIYLFFFLTSCSGKYIEKEIDGKGNLISSIEYVNLVKNEKVYEGEFIIYSDRGKRVIAEYKDNKLYSIYKYESINGFKLDFGTFKKGNGFLKVYDKNGIIWKSGIVKNGYPDGFWSFYSKDSVIIDNVEYRDGYSVYSKKKPTTIFLK